MYHNSDSIILKRVAYGEADLIVTFFCRDLGKLSGIAKSARSSIKRFGGAFEPGTLVSLSYTSRHESSLVQISEARVLRPVIGVVKTLKRINALSYSIELALRFLQERQRAEDKFNLLSSRIEHLSERDPDVLDSLIYELEWLKYCGFAPHIEGCTECGVALRSEPKWSFDFSRGGVLCPLCNCGRKGVLLANTTLKCLRSINLGEIDCDEKDSFVSVRQLMRKYINTIIARPLKVMDL